MQTLAPRNIIKDLMNFSSGLKTSDFRSIILRYSEHELNNFIVILNHYKLNQILLLSALLCKMKKYLDWSRERQATLYEVKKFYSVEASDPLTDSYITITRYRL